METVIFDEGDKESAPGAFDCLDESLEFDLGGSEAFGLGAYGIVCVDGDTTFKRMEVPVFFLVPPAPLSRAVHAQA